MKVKKVDTNHSAITQRFIELGATVLSLHTLGFGAPDLLVGFRGFNLLIEVKVPKGKLNNDQIKFRDKWLGHKPLVVRTEAEVEEIINNFDKIREQNDI